MDFDRRYIWLLVPAVLALVFWMGRKFYLKEREESVAMVNILNTSFGSVSSIPDPNNLHSSYQWYLLNHIFSPLVHFDHREGIFKPLIAESWSISGNVYTFSLFKDAKFHDGTPIRASDVEATIKNILRAKTVTHFPLWEFLVGCDNIKEIDDVCPGVQVINDTTIRFSLTGRKESFFLALSSPETGVWSKGDIRDFQEHGTIPKRFSGPYSVTQIDEKIILLNRNEHSPLIKLSPKAPNQIRSFILSRKQVEQDFLDKKIDLFFTDYIPFHDIDWEKQPIKIHYYSPSVLTYLGKNQHQLNRAKVGADLLEAMWNQSKDPQMMPAETFLPPGSLGLCKRQEILSALPATSSAKTIRIAVLENYYKDGFHELLKKSGERVGVNVVTEKISVTDWIKLSNGTHENDRWDYFLAPYVASERYPAVQLRFLLYGKPSPDEDIFNIDDPNSSKEKVERIRNFERSLVANQYVVPLFFTRMLIYYNKNLNIGDQPVTDSDVQLWRVTGAADD